MALVTLAPARAALAAAALLAAGALSGCGGGGGESSGVAKTPAELAQDLAREHGVEAAAGEDDPTGVSPSGERTGTLEFFVPAAVDAPSGYRLLDDACEAEDDDYGGYIRFAVPEIWTASGRGSSGSSYDLSGSVDHRFTTENGGVTIEFDRDQRDERDEVVSPDGEPTESFDYRYTTGDVETHVVHTEAFSATIDGRDLPVWTVTDGSDLHAGDDALYRVRVTAFHVTWPVDGRSTTSFTMTLTGAPEDLGDDVAKAIVESVQVSDCVRETVTVVNELTFSTDLDGDGEVATPEELQDRIG